MSQTDKEFFVQAKASIDFKKLEITSDGTEDGTTILLNGKPITDLSYLSFSFWGNCSYGNPVSIGFSTADPSPTPGTLTQSSYFSLCAPIDDDAGEASKKDTGRVNAKANLILKHQLEVPAAARPQPIFSRKAFAENFK